MDAKKLDEQLVDYLYGEMRPDQRAAFEAALSAHPEVRRNLEALQQTRAALSDLQDVEPPAEISERLLKEAVAHATHPAQTTATMLERLRSLLRVVIVHPALSAAVTVVVVVGVSLYVYRRSGPSPSYAPSSDLELVEPELAGGTATPAPAPAASAPGPAKDRAEESAPALQKTLGSAETNKVGTTRPRGRVARPRPSVRRRASKRAMSHAIPQTKPKAPIAADHRTEAKVERQPLERLAGPADSSGGAGGGERYGRPGKTVDRPSVAAEDEAQAPPARSTRARAPAEPAPESVYATKAVKRREARRDRGPGGEDWMRRAMTAVAARHCKTALAYFSRALDAKPQLAAEVDSRLGACAAVLARSEREFPRLAARLHQARAARNKRAPQDAPAANHAKDR